MHAELCSLQTQVSEMSLNLTRKIDALQCDRYLDSGMALHQIKQQLQQLTRSVDTCHSEVHEVKRDMASIKHDIDSLQQAKEEIEELRDCVDRLEQESCRKRERLRRRGRRGNDSVSDFLT